MTDNPVSRCAIPLAATRGAKATLGSSAGYGVRALRRLPPRSAVSQVNPIKGTAAPGEIGRCAADVHITRHSVKSPRSLRCVSFLGAIPRFAGPFGLNGMGIMSRAPAWLPSQHVCLEGGSSGQRHGVRACGASFPRRCKIMRTVNQTA
jgi:hypothetical protein